ncbi:MAG: EAL domain-containing protein [Gammaproteobacteria bacterium]
MNELLRILIIDDDDVDRMTVLRACKSAGVIMHAEEAPNGKIGLELLKTHTFDCVFLDYLLPDSDGLTILRAARTAGVDTPIVMLTGHGDERLAVEMMQAGANDYLPKGKISPESLAHSLRHAMRLHQAEIDRQAVERKLQASNRRITDILESISDAFFAVTSDWCVTYVNKEAERLLQSRRADLLDQNLLERLPHFSPWFREALIKAMSQKTPLTAEGFDAQSGLWIEAHSYPGNDGISVYFHDITERKQAEERLSFLANYDALTSLPNRILLKDRLAQALARLPWQNRVLGVLFCDLDRFKIVNDTLGHNVGDHLLKEMARRLKQCVRSGDTVARLGGDEFVILLTDMARAEDVGTIAQKIIESLGQPLNLEGQEVFVTASVGISLYPTDSADPDTLLKKADVAMYRAKDMGKNGYQFYSPMMDAKHTQRLSLESAMRHGLAREEFRVFYQPLVELVSGRIVGAEALIRWQHPELGMISPMDFLPLAEETGLIIPIGNWVLHTACAQAQAWATSGHHGLRMAVNLSNRQYRQDNLLGAVRNALERTGLAPTCLELELTEEIVMRNMKHSSALLESIRAMGIALAIDDFGTGYSSLGHLRRFPIQTVKVDRSFITDLPGNTDAAAITEAIIAMAHKLKLEVVAEGVETEAQRAFLQEQGCDVMQGYLFSPPVPAEKWDALWLKQSATYWTA